MKISKFEGEYAFLSNFYVAAFTYGADDKNIGDCFPTVEHCFQAAKTTDTMDYFKIRDAATPGKAKRLGRKTALRPDWDKVKFDLMMRMTHCKFVQNPEIAEKLIETGDAELVEGNNWGDTYWGVDLRTGIGENRLGIGLMLLRDILAGRIHV